MISKLKYLLRSIGNRNQQKSCPNCGSLSNYETDRKYLFTKLLKCQDCKLNFRFPKDSEVFSNEFYQSEYDAHYSEESQSITDLPDEETLNELMLKNFPNKRNHSPFVHALLKRYSAKVLDYGSSWGYSVFHLRTAGYEAEGFEISTPRAIFGKKINVEIHYQESAVGNNFDLIMSNHAIEHVPVISNFVKFASSRLTTDGIFMAFCPNGSPEYRRREPEVFHVNWGLLHPNYLDIEFATTMFRRNPFLILTGDWNYDLDELSSWDGKSQKIGERRDGKELMIVAKPNMTIGNV